ncbi:MAG: efflux transporter periplasmic adaptor subunit, partial [Bacteroidales bacterium]
EGMNITLTIGAIQDVKIPATLEYLSPKGVEENGAILFEIKAAATIPDSIFVRAGYSANAEIILDKRDSVLTIPESSVSFSNDTAYVYKLTASQPKQAFDKRIVELGLSDGINIEVKSGVTKEEKLRGIEITDKK